MEIPNDEKPTDITDEETTEMDEFAQLMKEMGIPTLEEKRAIKSIATTSIVKRDYLIEPEILPYQDILDAKETKQIPEGTKPKPPPYEIKENKYNQSQEIRKTVKAQKLTTLPATSESTKIREQETGTHPPTRQPKFPKIQEPVKSKKTLKQKNIEDRKYQLPVKIREIGEQETGIHSPTRQPKVPKIQEPIEQKKTLEPTNIEDRKYQLPVRIR